MDFIADSLIGETSASSPTAGEADILPAKVYAVMALTSGLTFATLVTGYELLFSHQLFA